MSATERLVAERYASALRDYLAGAEETALLRAYELGREAMDEGRGVLDVLAAHQEALGVVLLGAATAGESARVAGRAVAFLAESLASFHMAHRGFQESIVALRGLNEALARRVADLARERNRTAAILAGIGEGVGTTDAEGLIVSINPALERLAGRREEEVRGRHHAEAYPVFDETGEPVPPERSVLSRALGSRRVVQTRGFGLMLETREGRRVPVAMTASPVLDERGDLFGGVAVVRNVSHEREVDQLKSSLISTVSHEIRMPLTSILGFSELLLTRDTPEEQSREYLGQIHGAAARLTRLIEDLLSVSRIESGGLVVWTAPADLAGALEEVIVSLGERRDVRLDIRPGTPPVHADRDMLVQILTNLLANACKYSPPEAPVVVRAARRGAAVEVAVQDHGIGMTEEETQRIFDKFYRADCPEVRAVAGSGLGLSITKSLVELQGGQIWVRSEPGHGSTFSFSLPAVTENGEGG